MRRPHPRGSAPADAADVTSLPVVVVPVMMVVTMMALMMVVPVMMVPVADLHDTRLHRRGPEGLWHAGSRRGLRRRDHDHTGHQHRGGGQNER